MLVAREAMTVLMLELRLIAQVEVWIEQVFLEDVKIT